MGCMRIGIKFCGGCNPYYERGEAVRRLKERFPQHSFEAVSAEERYDMVLLVCGCRRACVEYYRGATAGRYIVLKDSEEFTTLSLEKERL